MRLRRDPPPRPPPERTPQANRGSMVAAQALAERRRTGMFFESPADPGDRLRDEVRTGTVRSHVVDGRSVFTGYSRADRLVDFFRRTLDRHGGPASPAFGAPGGRRRRRDTKLKGTPRGAPDDGPASGNNLT